MGDVEKEEDKQQMFPGSGLPAMVGRSEDLSPLNQNEPKASSTRQRPDSPVSSCLSMKTDWSKERPLNFRQEPGPSDTDSHSRQLREQRSDSPVSSCLSMETDWSKERPLNFHQEPGPSDTDSHRSQFLLQRPDSPVSSCLSMETDWSKERPLNFCQEPGHSGPFILQNEESAVPSLLSVKSDWSKERPLNFSQEPGPSDIDIRKRSHVSADERQSSCGLCRGILRDPVCIACGHQVCSQCLTSLSDQCGSSGDVALSCSQCEERAQTKAKLQTIDQSCTRADTLHKVLEEHKINLKSRCEHVTEGTDEAESGTLLKSIYTELYITEGQSEEVNAQHEVRQLETASKMTTPHDTPIKCHEIFTPLPHQHRHIRVVMTNGVAGVGKTFSVQKFTLDWAEGLENQDVSLLILLSFRELNLIRDKKYSLLTLLHIFHPTLQRLTAEKLSLCKLLFIFDGLDESRLGMDFNTCEVVSDVTQTSSVNVLLANLIKGSLLPSAQVWITSRPAAANQIPSLYIGRITEVRGFTDAQKEQYFRKRFSDQDLSDRMIAHIKSSRSLYIMCLIPVFCWITATVLEHMFTTDQKELPKTLTDMYSHFLLVQTTRKKKKYGTEFEMSPQELMQTESDVLLKLGRLAFEHLEKGNIMFYREDLEQCGLDVEEALVYSGVCTEIFKRECVIFEETVYCFVHLSIQEFLAAVYMFHCYTNENTVILEPLLGKDYHQSLLDVFLKTAMEKSLKSKTGHLDLFVRFLHGLSLKSNQRLIGGLLGETNNNQEIIQRAINNLKDMNTNKISPDRSINIFHCLTEMNDQSVHQEIEDFLKSKKRSGKELSEIHCSALAYMLQMSEEVLEELDLKNYNTTVEGRRRLIPAVRNCRKALISRCGLSETQSEVVALALRSNPSHLKELDLSRNILQDAGVKVLSAGLESPYCRLETLRLRDCSLSEISCASLASAMKSNPCSLKELDLSRNVLQDSGVKLLSVGLEDPYCKLQTLRLRSCQLTEISCTTLASAVKGNPAHLRELDLSNNNLQDSGVKLLCTGLESPQCKLESLRLSHCSLSNASCDPLVSVLTFNPSHLRELELNDNDLQESDVKPLSDLVENPHCRLETLHILETMNFFSMKGSSFSSTGVWKTSDSEDEVSVPEYPDSICDLLKDAKPPLSDEPESSHTQDGKASGASLDKHEDDLPTLNTGIIESEDSREQKVDEDQLQPDDREKNKISFTPDLLMDSNKASYRFRCPGPGVYQCAMTGLVFEMAQEAELLYKTAQWDVSAVHLTGMTAAGPLFDIKCSEDAAVTHLHLPHCEIMDVALPDGLLSVAHFTADGMSVIEPHEMTDTHVIVRVSQLSVFGLIWNIVKRVWAKPVKGQILLFLRPSELSVFLLPGNVPLNEVAIQQDDAVNIKVSSDCQLSFGQSYSFHCEPENIPIQPNQVSFQSKFGPNFFTTFQVFLTPSQSQRLTLSILNESRREVWNHDLDLTKAPPTG
ncbi:uncharacterized protein V6R79_019017 [Siganus canaliculatus]